MKILALSTKLNQILYTYSVGPQKAGNAKTNHPKWGGKNKNSNSLDQRASSSLTKSREISSKTLCEKTGQFRKSSEI